MAHTPSTRLYPAIEIRFPDEPADQPPADAPQADTGESHGQSLWDRILALIDDFQPRAIEEIPSGQRVFLGSAASRAEAARLLSAAFRDGSVAVSEVDVPDDGWALRSQADLGPVRVGQIVVRPPWLADEVDGAAVGVIIRPSMGFGTGHHASTRLCLALLQQVDVRDKTVLDVGTGSGVLAIAARLLGAARVTAIDSDADAIEAAVDNLVLNQLATGVVLRHTALEALEALPADLVLANLTGTVICRESERLLRHLAPPGDLILGGLMVDEEAAVLEAFRVRARLVTRLSEDEWVGLLLRT